MKKAQDTISVLALLRKRRFLPLFITQFGGAFNDNIFRTAMITLFGFGLAQQMGVSAPQLNALAQALFILPFFLFSALAGQCADKYQKARLTRLLKLVEIALMGFGGWAMAVQNVPAMFAVIFLLGLQSTFFGPIKYSILPQALDERELVAGNGLIEAGTYLAILGGTLAGSLIIGSLQNWVIGLGLLVAVLGWLAARQIPAVEIADPSLPLRSNVFASTWEILRFAASNRTAFLCILGISWFWAVGAAYMTQLAPFVSEVLRAEQSVFTLFLFIFSVGIGLGSLLCNRLLRGQINAYAVPYGAIAIAVFSMDLYFAGQIERPIEIQGMGLFLSHLQSWRIMGDLFLISVAGGIYSVPLYAILQHRSDPAQRARMIAANNVLNSAFIVAMAVLIMVMSIPVIDLAIADVFLVIACLSAAAALVICRILPHETMKGIFALFFRIFFRVKIHGIENFYAAGSRIVIVVNHVSFLDAALMASFLPGKMTFAIHSEMVKTWWVRPFLSLVDSFPLDPLNPMAARHMIKAVEEGRKCVIFPEGRLTVTGALMKIHAGPAVIATRAKAKLLPVRIDGAQYTIFSRLKGRVPQRLFPRITLTILPPITLLEEDTLPVAEKRQQLAENLYDVMAGMMVDAQDPGKTLLAALLAARDLYGGNRIILDKPDGRPVTYDTLLGDVERLACHLRIILAASASAGPVGIYCEDNLDHLKAMLALQSIGKEPALIPAGSFQNILAARRSLKISTLLTTQVELSKLGKKAEDELRRDNITIHVLDSLASQSGWFQVAAWHRRLRQLAHKGSASQTALWLFAISNDHHYSAFAFTHEALIRNYYQLTARIDLMPTDRVFNTLPVTHAFGLAGTWMPLLAGMRAYLCSETLPDRTLAELAYDWNATILLAEDRRLYEMGKIAHPYDFYSVRYVFTGGPQRLRSATRSLWMDKFGLRLLEGYGSAAVGPVLAVNTPMQFQSGTAGRLLPGVDVRLRPLQGFNVPSQASGWLSVRMRGKAEENWRQTGDLISIDRHGFVTRRGVAGRVIQSHGHWVALDDIERWAEEIAPAQRHFAYESGPGVITLATEGHPLDTNAFHDMISSKRYLSPLLPIELTTVQDEKGIENWRDTSPASGVASEGNPPA